MESRINRKTVVVMDAEGKFMVTGRVAAAWVEGEGGRGHTRFSTRQPSPLKEVGVAGVSAGWCSLWGGVV